jgi:hypothetical protein
VVAFVVAGLLAFGGATAEFGGGSNRLELWEASTSSRSVRPWFSAVALAWLVSAYAPALPGWPLAAFVAAGAYLLIVGLEQTAADR